jgi:hypothetical protein
MIRFFCATFLIFLASGCGGRENASRFQGVVQKIDVERNKRHVKGWIYFENVDIEGLTYKVAGIQWTDETKFFLVEGKNRKPTDVENLKPSMKVEVKLVPKVEKLPGEGPHQHVTARAAEILILEKE